MPAELNGFDYDGDLLFTTDNEVLRTTLKGSIQSHLIAFASEKSRLEKTIAQLTQRLELVEESLANL